MCLASTGFERGGKYFHLTIVRSTDPSKPTTIRHPTPCDGNSDNELTLSTKDDGSDRTQDDGYDDDVTPRAKVQFRANAPRAGSKHLNEFELASPIESRRSRDPIRAGSKPLLTPSKPLEPMASVVERPKPTLSKGARNSRALERTSSRDISSLFSGDLPDLTSSNESGGSGDSSDSSSKQKGNTNIVVKKSSLPIKALMAPINIKIANASPYDLPRHLTVYNSKTPQTWYYDRQKCPILIPPTPAKGVIIPFKSIYVCDVVDSGGNCRKRQVWINGGKEKVHWAVADETHAVLKLDGSTYVAYVNSEGPHWVRKETWQKYKKPRVS